MARRPKKRDLTTETLNDEPIRTRETVAGEPREDLLMEATHRIRTALDWWRENHEASREDVEFTYLQQWPDEVAAERANRPMLTFNTLPRFINQVVGQARQSQYSIQVSQVSGIRDEGKTVGEHGVMMSRAEIMEGMIRDIEVRSDASRAYCRAFQHALEGGFGWLIVRRHNPPEDPFSSELMIEHVKDRYSILIDQTAVMANYEDAMWCQHSVRMPMEEYRARYPDAGPAGMVGGTEDTDHRRWWGDDDNVRVSDYWWKEPMDRVAVRLENEGSVNADGLTLFEDEYRDILDELWDRGYREVSRTTVKTFKVQYIRHTAMEILDGPWDWPSCHLPVVPVLGRQVDHEGTQYYQGVVRHARDPIRTMNYWMSAMTETVALAPKTPWLLTPAQIAGFEDDWKDQGRKNLQFLLYNPDESDTGAPPPTRVPTRNMPQGEMAIVGITRDLTMDTIGIYEAGLGQKSNETSGVAISQRRTQSDTSVYEFTDNLARSITHVGTILCDMIPRVYTMKATRQIIMPDDSVVEVDLNEEVMDEETGKMFKVASLSHARYTCRTKVGPATRTQREEFVQVMTEWGKTDPQGFTVARDLIVKALEIPGGEEIARRFQYLVPRQMLRPEQQEKLPPPEPTPEEQAEMAKAQAEMAKAQAQIQMAQIGLEIEQVRQQIAEANLETAKVRLQTAMESGIEAEKKDVDDRVAQELASRP